MASISEAQAELIRYVSKFEGGTPDLLKLTVSSSLAPDDIPHKLRCANCSKLAVNAFRLPCCEQAICESCMGSTPLADNFNTDLLGHSSLPSSCPVCEHSPLSADDCTPNKSLRTTIKVFLRTAEKKREANRPKEIPERPAPETPVEAAQTAQPAAEDTSVKDPENKPSQAAQPSIRSAEDGPIEVAQGVTEVTLAHRHLTT